MEQSSQALGDGGFYQRNASMDQHRLTPSACRALQQAARLAAETGRPAVEPICLLWALLREESQAAEILHGRGVSLDSLDKADRHHPSDSANDSQKSVQVANDPAAALKQSAALEAVVQEAHRRGGMMGRHTEVGSEHLLWGLAAVDSPVKELLEAKGIDEGFLIEQIESASGITAAPLEDGVPLIPEVQTKTDRADACRILDAAANRAREGLRVVEDFVRFTLDDQHLTRLLKQCRHDLTTAVRRFDDDALRQMRETTLDVGTGVTTEAETVRRSPLDVARANFKRIQEALRTLEEFGKLISASAAERFEQIRYRLYTLEKAILSTHESRRRLEGVNLYLLATERLCHHGSGPAIREAAAAGAGMVQLREKSMTDRQLLAQGRRVREWTREAGALFIMNDRADLTVLADADGVHVGQGELTVREARRIVGPGRLVGVSTHSIEQARQAVLDGADYIGVGPVFSTATKQFAELAGLELVQRVAAEITLPWFAIGGITEANVGEVIAAGAARIAVSGAICGAEQPAAATKQLGAALETTQRR